MEGLVDVSIPASARQPTVGEGRRLMELTLAQVGPRPTAVFAHNDLLAIGAIDAIRAAGLECPRDISVVGYNDALLADHLSPSLSSVRMPMLELGQRAAELAMELIEDPERKLSPVLISPALVARDSSGPALQS